MCIRDRFDAAKIELDDIVRILDMLYLAVVAFWPTVKSLFNKMTGVAAIMLICCVCNAQDSIWVKVEKPIHNPFLIELNESNLQTASLGAAWGVLKRFGAAVFSEDIRHSIAKELSLKCKDYEKDLIEDGKKYRQLMVNYYEALQISEK